MPNARSARPDTSYQAEFTIAATVNGIQATHKYTDPQRPLMQKSETL